MIVKVIAGILLATSLTGCFAVNAASSLLEEFNGNEVSEVTISENKTEVFQDLLKQGWKIHVFKGKVLLLKETEDGLIINDVFSVLKEN
jgi:hypothetical protein